ncbi:MAG: alanine--tRNA ligase-related protein [Ilumatobacteraceae bacterium]
MSQPKTANELRQAFTGFFQERGHSVVPSASLIPHDPTVLFTVAGMVPFKPYFTGDEQPPFRRAVSVQKCARAGGKHNDLDDVGRTKRHLVAFEMLGNFSFGDYFKTEAIPWSWELVTEVFGFDGDQLWITVHESDDEAEAIWHEQVGVPMDRIQRLGDKDNFWQMGETGPCGPCSEIHIDRGPAFGPPAARSAIPPATGSWSSGTWSSCSTTRRPTARARRCPSRRSTPVPGSADPDPDPGQGLGLGDRSHVAGDRPGLLAHWCDLPDR